jgi:hypothetical protein
LEVGKSINIRSRAQRTIGTVIAHNRLTTRNRCYEITTEAIAESQVEGEQLDVIGYNNL